MDVLEEFIMRLKESRSVEEYECGRSGKWFIVDDTILLIVKRHPRPVPFGRVYLWIEQIQTELAKISESRGIQLKPVLVAFGDLARGQVRAFEDYGIQALSVEAKGGYQFMRDASCLFGI